MGIIARLRLLLSLRSLASAGEKELRMGWNYKLTLQKMLVSLLTHGGAVLISTLAMLPDSALNAWLLAQGVPPSIVAVATPLLMMALRGLDNWWKHRVPGPLAPSTPPTPPSPTSPAPAGERS